MAEQDFDQHACDEYNRLGRRDFLKVGMLSALGLGLSEYFAMGEASAKGLDNGSATSAILIWMGGGPSHLDTFDLKPGAPVEIRGQFKPVATSANGIQISEHLPRIAKVMDKAAIIRSMT